MKTTKTLQIGSVKIAKVKNKLTYFLPSSFSGQDLTKFKEEHKEQIEQFKNS